MEFRQLLPEPASVEIATLLASIRLDEPGGVERPYTIANFIASADGRATFQGRSGQLGDPADRELFHGLREHVDAVFAGTTTIRIEQYGRLVREPERRARREQAGRSPEPLACVVTRSGDVPSDAPLFAEPEARIVVFTAVALDLGDCEAAVEVVRLDPDELTLTTVVRLLRSDFGVSSLLCEGGPTVFGSLVREHLVDELFLTLAPRLVGGGASPTISSGAELPQLQQMELVWALEHAGSLYLRYRLP